MKEGRKESLYSVKVSSRNMQISEMFGKYVRPLLLTKTTEQKQQKIDKKGEKNR